MSRIIFAGGGTAGHVEPALAVARLWKIEHSEDEILFLGTSSGLETRLVPEAGFDLALITKVRIARTLSPTLLLAPFALMKSISECLTHLRGADLLVGFGGYVSGPAYFAAALLRIPIVIHEANARPGVANRIGAHLTKHTAVAYPVASGALSGALLAGLPLKENIAKAFAVAQNDWVSARAQAKRSLGFDTDRPLVFIFGGSQGSVAINSVITQSIAGLNSRGIQILHAVGAANQSVVSNQNYRAESYITDMATAYLAADLIISRSGAVTCSEISTLGRFALFIPLAVGNGEQELNAAVLVKNSRAEIRNQKRFSSEWLIDNIDRLLQQSVQSDASGSAQDVNAASKIASLMEFVLAGGR